VLDDHMSAGGHVAGAEHSERHVAAESGLMRTSAAALGARLTEAEQALLESCARGWVSCLGAMPDVAVQWTSAQGAFAALSAELLPAVVHIAAGPGSSEDAPLGIRWRIFRAVLTRRLPPVPRRD
jgi:roadblock/LC7 domain-containing protein